MISDSRLDQPEAPAFTTRDRRVAPKGTLVGEAGQVGARGTLREGEAQHQRPEDMGVIQHTLFRGEHSRSIDFDNGFLSTGVEGSIYTARISTVRDEQIWLLRSTLGIDTASEREGLKMKIPMRRMGSFVVSVIGVGILALAAGSAAASPISIPISEFSPSASVIDFNTIAPFVPVTNQFQPTFGVTFSGGLTGSTVIGSVQTPPPFSTGDGSPITITFDQTMSQVGFDLSGNSGESVLVTVEAYSNGQLMPTGQLQFDIVANSPTTIFAGIRDLQGIDTLVLKGIPASGTQGFIMDNLRFEAAAAVVPEPSAALLFPAGLALAASCVRRRQRKLA